MHSSASHYLPFVIILPPSPEQRTFVQSEAFNVAQLDNPHTSRARNSLIQCY